MLEHVKCPYIDLLIKGIKLECEQDNMKSVRNLC